MGDSVRDAMNSPEARRADFERAVLGVLQKSLAGAFYRAEHVPGQPERYVDYDVFCRNISLRLKEIAQHGEETDVPF